MAEEKPQSIEGEIVNPGRSVSLTKHDENIVKLLEAAFNNAFNITEACQYAGISRTTFYEWLADDDIFSYRMSIAQAAPNKEAKRIVMEAIQKGDPGLALRFLTLRDPDFKPKATLEPPVGAKETRQKIKDFLDDNSDLDDPGSEPAATDPASA